MDNVNHRLDGDTLVVKIAGHVDSVNAHEIEGAINALRGEHPHGAVEVDCADLEYISSAGLRVLLRLKQAEKNLKVTNVSSQVYDIFEMTGFTEIMEIQKATRVISVEGCEVIGQGANGKVYRIDRDTIVKVYLNPDALPEIHRERELARTAFVLGVPTAIPYDVVRIAGGGYGSVFELLNAASLAKLLIRGEMDVEEIARRSIDLLKIIHATEVDPASMPDMKAVALDWADFLKDYLPADRYAKLRGLIEAVPQDNHMLHGDYHLKNVMVQNGESLLIDMDTLCHGHPVFELASMFNAYVGYSAVDHSIVESFLGIPRATSLELWRRSLSLYLNTEDQAAIDAVEEKAMVVGYTRIMRRTIRRGGLENEGGRALIDYCRSELERLLGKVDTLVF